MSLITGPLQSFLGRLRFPTLFGIAALLFLVDFITPDPIFLVDEMLLGAIAALFAAWKKRKDTEPPKDATD